MSFPLLCYIGVMIKFPGCERYLKDKNNSSKVVKCGRPVSWGAHDIYDYCTYYFCNAHKPEANHKPEHIDLIRKKLESRDKKERVIHVSGNKRPR